jgi:hypothetical protein
MLFIFFCLFIFLFHQNQYQASIWLPRAPNPRNTCSPRQTGLIGLIQWVRNQFLRIVWSIKSPLATSLIPSEKLGFNHYFLVIYHLDMTNSLPWKPWPMKIDGLPIKKWWFSMAMSVITRWYVHMFPMVSTGDRRNHHFPMARSPTPQQVGLSSTFRACPSRNRLISLALIRLDLKHQFHTWTYPLVNCPITMENHHAINGKTHYFNDHVQ